MQAHLKLLVPAVVLVAGASGFLAAAHFAPTPAGTTTELARSVERQTTRLDALIAKLSTDPPPRGACAARPAEDSGLLRAEIARILHEELESRKGDDLNEVAREDQHEPSSESRAAVDKSEVLLASAATSRRWGATEEDEMSLLVPQMTLKQHERAMQKLSMMINRGEIALER